jgi:hypothetical protein
MATYIADGYTKDGYVKASDANQAGESLYGSLGFTYRPSTRIDNVRHDAEVKTALKDEFNPKPDDAVKAEMLACKFVASKLVSWDLEDDKDNGIAITPDNCSRLNAGLFYRVYSIIRGTALSDPKPGTEKPESSDEEQQKN